MKTRITKVKDIPYYVSDKFLRTYARNRYQLGQVEQMVETSYRNYLISECKNQKLYKAQLQRDANRQTSSTSDVERKRKLKKANEFELPRCVEYEELFGR